MKNRMVTTSGGTLNFGRCRQLGCLYEVAHTDADKQAAVVTMRIDDEGLPIHKDARAAIRPRSLVNKMQNRSASPTS